MTMTLDKSEGAVIGVLSVVPWRFVEIRDWNPNPVSSRVKRGICSGVIPSEARYLLRCHPE